MKFSLWIFSALAVSTKVLAEKVPYYEMKPPAADPEEEPDTTGLKKYSLHYDIEEYPGQYAPNPVPFMYGDSITLNYKFENKEENAITIVGLGGSFVDPHTGETLVNMTANSVEPVVLKPQTAGSVRQRINIEFPIGDYVLAPIVYVSFQDEMIAVPGEGKLVNVSEPPVSFFDPQFIFLELVFLAIGGAIAYYYFGKQIRAFLNESVVPVNQKTAAKASTSGSSTSWVPKNYHPVEKKSKSRKAY